MSAINQSTDIDHSEDFLNNTNRNDDYYYDYEDYYSNDPVFNLGRITIITTYPVIILFGTIGNLLTLLIMRRGSLKFSSSCFYMSILALADTGKGIFNN